MSEDVLVVEFCPDCGRHTEFAKRPRGEGLGGRWICWCRPCNLPVWTGVGWSWKVAKA